MTTFPLVPALHRRRESLGRPRWLQEGPRPVGLPPDHRSWSGRAQRRQRKSEAEDLGEVGAPGLLGLAGDRRPRQCDRRNSLFPIGELVVYCFLTYPSEKWVIDFGHQTKTKGLLELFFSVRLHFGIKPGSYSYKDQSSALSTVPRHPYYSKHGKLSTLIKNFKNHRGRCLMAESFNKLGS